uniref:Uncharacterized protein LOC104231978 n=1 Tax=Nicotiana sylvestris TaxID=4096 RepID=A0A1U7X128_NICSY|nr:PREDICTED: uncharacterized protein LOC104231978 [Nicotiana sylvestris]
MAKILQKRKGKNGVGILVDRELKEFVVEVRWVNYRLMYIKLVVGAWMRRSRGASGRACGYGNVHGGVDFGDRNPGGTLLLDFVKAFELVIANSSFPKREEYLVTFQSIVAKTKIYYLLLRRCNRGLCKDCKVIWGEALVS